MWYEESVFYQIYPLGFCGAPDENDGQTVDRIGKLADWTGHMQRLGVNALYLCPVFDSDTHGYDTRDYRIIDCRLGGNGAFRRVCETLHGAGIRVVLDGVFHHVGRGFWAFRDVLDKREASPYRDWFFIDFSRDDNYGDGLWYEGWEGHYEMVKLNLNNPSLRAHLFDCVRSWAEEFGIDGLRLDVAYLLEQSFLRELREVAESIAPDFFLLGEAIHGDYRQIAGPGLLHSCTNYECFKGIFSSFNDHNMHEIAYSLNRQFGPEDWTIYRDLPLYSFVDNHDGTRLASNLKEPGHLAAAYGLLFGMPGIPSVYYGSEWGAQGVKVEGTDHNLRPCFEGPEWNALCDRIAGLARIRRSSSALQRGGYRQLWVESGQLVFQRQWGEERVLVAVNAADRAHTVTPDVHGELECLPDGERLPCDGRLELAPMSTAFYRLHGG